MKVLLMAHLVETGEMEKAEVLLSGKHNRLKSLLKEKLIKSGWRDEMKVICKEIVQQRGVDKITVDDLVKAITKQGRERVQEDIKKELLCRIRTFLKTSKDVE